MNRKDVREFLKKRSTIWTLSLCMTGAIVLGGITSMDQARRKAELTETESEPGAQAQLDVNDTLGSSLDEEEAESDPVAAVAGNEVTEEKLTEAEKKRQTCRRYPHPSFPTKCWYRTGLHLQPTRSSCSGRLPGLY